MFNIEDNQSDGKAKQAQISLFSEKTDKDKGVKKEESTQDVPLEEDQDHPDDYFDDDEEATKEAEREKTALDELGYKRQLDDDADAYDDGDDYDD